MANRKSNENANIKLKDDDEKKNESTKFIIDMRNQTDTDRLMCSDVNRLSCF